jgi:hypothetical protein
MKAIPLVSAVLLLAVGSAAAAQQPGGPGDWGGDRALELIRRAQVRRARTAVDPDLISYQARATGRVYFYLDREDTGERNLVKTDQLALEVIWQAPDLMKQRIIGWRDQRSLPTNIHYHLDHLSVVQENFGDEIRIGDGDEVHGVIHPAAAAAENFYEYRLADSLTLALPGAGDPVRVYEVQARPRDPRQPAFVGSVFVDRRSGDIVRMDFTFTAAAYVDRYLDYINISLDNGLWLGKYWLPNEQRVEIRRTIPQLDIPAGSVIRGNMRIGGYRFNEPIPLSAFAGPPVVTVPREQREAYPFEEALDAEVREEGLGEQVELGEIRRRASELVRASALRRIGGIGFHAERASEVVRYDRAEGLALGVGLAGRPLPHLAIGATAGYAFGAELVQGRLRAEGGNAWRWEVAAYLNQPRDLRPGPAASGAVNTLAALFAARDYTDLFYASGAEARLRRSLGGGWTASMHVGTERHRRSWLAEEFSPAGGAFRPVFPIRSVNRLATGGAGLSGGTPSGRSLHWRLFLGAEAWHGFGAGAAGWLEPTLDGSITRRWNPADAQVELRARGGAQLGAPPEHLLYLLGGRGTIPGFGFRAFGGSRFMVGDATAAADLAHPWLRGRALASAGWVAGTSPSWAEPVSGPHLSIGAGLGLFYDILRVDLARGLGDRGRWELVVETRREFWDFL